MERHVFKDIFKFFLLIIGRVHCRGGECKTNNRERGHGLVLLLWNDRMVVERSGGAGWTHWFHLVKIRLSIWVGSHSSSSSFDLRTLDTLAEKRLSSKEELMVIGSTIGSFGDTVETVEVQLPLEGGIFLLLEEPDKTLRMLREKFGLVYNETTAVRLPGDDMRKIRLD
jgi:hypothetical protein